MSYPESRKFWKRRTRSSFLTAVISIGVVLYFLGLFGGISFFGLDVLKEVEENLVMEVFLHDFISEPNRQKLESRLDSLPMVREVHFIDKEEAAEKMLSVVGEEVKESLGGINPYLASFQLRFEPSSIRKGGPKLAEEVISRQSGVAEIVYQGDALPQLERNLRVFSWIALALGVVLSLMAVSLAYATIRLTIYARRLTIRSMELIGATRSFIRRPFLWRGTLQGMLGGLLALLLLSATLYLISLQLREMEVEKMASLPPTIIVLFGGIVLFGSILGFSGSYWAVNKYLNRNLDELL